MTGTKLPHIRHAPALAAALLCLGAACMAAQAQELQPRAYWPAPTGTKVLSLGYQLSRGDIITDPSLPITGVESRIHFLQATYQQTFGLFGRTTNFQFNLPYTSGHSEGIVDGQFRTRDIHAFTDARIRMSVNLRGAPAMDPEGFKALLAKPETIIGASLMVQAPTGEYDPDRLLNAGTNRWAVKPAVGLIWPMRPGWLFETELGAWIFGKNDQFVGSTREQDPIFSSEFHLVKLFDAGLWVSLDMNLYAGGRTTVDGVERDDLQRSSRFGATLVFPFKRQHALRCGYSTGVVTETGSDFDMFSLAYFYIWR